MKNRTIEPSEDLFEFAEECVRAGRYATGDKVVQAALEEKRRTLLSDALDVGIAELDAGLGVECTPDELIAEISAELGLDS
jgi:Arc/MetJ-type ribon-helix-helix transcriptional regulator